MTTTGRTIISDIEHLADVIDRAYDSGAWDEPEARAAVDAALDLLPWRGPRRREGRGSPRAR